MHEPRFTGKIGDTQYHKGRIWLGPTNMVGHRTRPRTRFNPELKAVQVTSLIDGHPVHGTKHVSHLAENDGPFVMVPVQGVAGKFGIQARS